MHISPPPLSSTLLDGLPFKYFFVSLQHLNIRHPSICPLPFFVLLRLPGPGATPGGKNRRTRRRNDVFSISFGMRPLSAISPPFQNPRSSLEFFSGYFPPCAHRQTRTLVLVFSTKRWPTALNICNTNAGHNSTFIRAHKVPPPPGRLRPPPSVKRPLLARGPSTTSSFNIGEQQRQQHALQQQEPLAFLFWLLSLWPDALP